MFKKIILPTIVSKSYTNINPSDYAPLVDNPFTKEVLLGNNMAILNTKHGYTIYKTAYRKNYKLVFPRNTSNSDNMIFNYKGIHFYTRE